jgi:hypothetical protein
MTIRKTFSPFNHNSVITLRDTGSASPAWESILLLQQMSEQGN